MVCSRLSPRMRYSREPRSRKSAAATWLYLASAAVTSPMVRCSRDKASGRSCTIKAGSSPPRTSTRDTPATPISRLASSICTAVRSSTGLPPPYTT